VRPDTNGGSAVAVRGIRTGGLSGNDGR